MRTSLTGLLTISLGLLMVTAATAVVSGPPSAVWVDDGWAGLAAGTAVGDHTIGADAFAGIQAAITAVAEGGTVNVAVGTYAERLSINKPLTLRGPQYGIDPTGSARTNLANEALVTAAGLGVPNPDVLVEIPAGVNGVTIDGFALFGNTSGNADTSAVRCWGGSATISHNGLLGQYGIIFKGASNLTAEKNVVAATASGIVVQPLAASNVTITGNYLTGAGATGQAIYLTGTTGADITGNTAKHFSGGSGLAGSNLTNLTVTGNTFEDCGKGVNLWGNTTDVTIADNTISGSGSVGINVKGADIEIRGNTVAGSGDSGITIARNTIDTANVTLSGNTLTANTNSGISIAASVSGVSITSGTIAGSAVGLLLTGVSGWNLPLGSTSFDASCTEFIRLTSTTANVAAGSATFSGAATDVDKEAKVWHDLDDAALGHVDWGQGPASASVVTVANVTGQVGDSVQLTAKVTVSGAGVAGRSVAFSLDGTALGSAATDAAGVAALSYTIATAGNKTITAAVASTPTSYAGTGTGTLTVQAPAPKSLTLTLAPTSVVSGATTTCTVTGDNAVNYTGLCTYYVQYGAGGSWAGNVYTAGKAGTWTVTAIYNMLSATATLTVTPGAAATLSLTPATATINVGESQTYTVTATDAAGNTFTPPASCLSENGAGSFTAYTYTAAADDAGDPVTITAALAPATSVTATLTVNAAAGTGNILAWDKDTRAFYLCSNATNPQAGTLVNVSGTYGAYTVAVSGGGTNVTVTTADGSSLQMYWYVRSGALYRCYQYSRIGGATKTATFDGTRTLVDGSWKTGFYGLTHTLSDAGAATYGAVKQ